MPVKEGFFAKVNGKNIGPFDTLSETRSEARKNGKDIPIFYGIVVTDDSGKTVKEELYLVPKVKKED